MNARLIIGSLALAASTALFAQGPAQSAGPKDGHRGMHPCAQEPDPAKCEARRKEMREKFKGARESCKGKGGPEHENCMAQQICANRPDPAKCIADAKERRDRRQMRDKGAAPKT